MVVAIGRQCAKLHVARLGVDQRRVGVLLEAAFDQAQVALLLAPRRAGMVHRLESVGLLLVQAELERRLLRAA